MGKFSPRMLPLIAVAAVLAGCHGKEPTHARLPPPLAKALGPSGKVNAAGESPLWAAQVRPGLIQVSLESGGGMSSGIRSFTSKPTLAIWEGTTTDGTRLRVVVEAKACHDAAIGMAYPLSARVEAGGHTLFGCAAAPGQGLGPRE